METKFESGRHREVTARADGWYIKGCSIVRHGGTIVYKPNRFMILFSTPIFRHLKFNLPVRNTWEISVISVP